MKNQNYTGLIEREDGRFDFLVKRGPIKKEDVKELLEFIAEDCKIDQHDFVDTIFDFLLEDRKWLWENIDKDRVKKLLLKLIDGITIEGWR